MMVHFLKWLALCVVVFCLGAHAPDIARKIEKGVSVCWHSIAEVIR